MLAPAECYDSDSDSDSECCDDSHSQSPHLVQAQRQETDSISPESHPNAVHATEQQRMVQTHHSQSTSVVTDEHAPTTNHTTLQAIEQRRL